MSVPPIAPARARQLSNRVEGENGRRAVDEGKGEDDDSGDSQRAPPVVDFVPVGQHDVGAGEGMHQHEKEEGDINALPQGIGDALDDPAEVDMARRVVHDDHMDSHKEEQGDGADTLHLENAGGVHGYLLQRLKEEHQHRYGAGDEDKHGGGEHGIEEALAVFRYFEIVHDEQAQSVDGMVDDGSQQEDLQEGEDRPLDHGQPLVEAVRAAQRRADDPHVHEQV